RRRPEMGLEGVPQGPQRAVHGPLRRPGLGTDPRRPGGGRARRRGVPPGDGARTPLRRAHRPGRQPARRRAGLARLLPGCAGSRVPGLLARRRRRDRGPLGCRGQARGGVDAPDHGPVDVRQRRGRRSEAHTESTLRRRRRALPADHALTRPLMRAPLPIGLAALVVGLGIARSAPGTPGPAGSDQERFTPRTRVSRRGAGWYINDELTNRGTRAEGLLMNVRMVNAVFEDRRKPDLDPAAITDRFLAHMPEYAAHGVNA